MSNLDCSDNQLSSLYLSCNLNLTQLDCSDNQLSVTLDENNCIDIAILPGFDPDRASNWEGGQIEGSRLQFTQDEVSYTYEPKSVIRLRADCSLMSCSMLLA